MVGGSSTETLKNEADSSVQEGMSCEGRSQRMAGAGCYGKGLLERVLSRSLQ